MRINLGLARIILYGRENRQMSEGPSSLVVTVEKSDCALIRIWKRDLVKQFASLNSLSDSYLVDPASSHMLVSKIKPCMCSTSLIKVKPRMAH